MFTGIITNLGRVEEKLKDKLVIRVGKEIISRLSGGDSISINGICLTVVSLEGEVFSVDFTGETEKRTNIRYLRLGDPVNLELPATLNTFLSGHIVQGHVDETGKLEGIEKTGNSRVLKFSVPASISKYLIEKGPVCANGISLTIIEAKDNYFTVSIIPYTWDNTMLNQIKLGDIVNIEADILAKYIEKFI